MTNLDDPERASPKRNARRQRPFTMGLGIPRWADACVEVDTAGIWCRAIKEPECGATTICPVAAIAEPPLHGRVPLLVPNSGTAGPAV